MTALAGVPCTALQSTRATRLDVERLHSLESSESKNDYCRLARLVGSVSRVVGWLANAYRHEDAENLPEIGDRVLNKCRLETVSGQNPNRAIFRLFLGNFEESFLTRDELSENG